MKPTINVTPLIDVLLVLLIIFMVAAPSRPTAFKALVPDDSAVDATLQKRDPLIIHVSRAGVVSIAGDKEVADLNDLEPLTRLMSARLAAETLGEPTSQNRERSLVQLHAAGNIPYGKVVNIIDALKTGGASPVVLRIQGS